MCAHSGRNLFVLFSFVGRLKVLQCRRCLRRLYCRFGKWIWPTLFGLQFFQLLRDVELDWGYVDLRRRRYNVWHIDVLDINRSVGVQFRCTAKDDRGWFGIVRFLWHLVLLLMVLHTMLGHKCGYECGLRGGCGSSGDVGRRQWLWDIGPNWANGLLLKFLLYLAVCVWTDYRTNLVRNKEICGARNLSLESVFVERKTNAKSIKNKMLAARWVNGSIEYRLCW